MLFQSSLSEPSVCLKTVELNFFSPSVLLAPGLILSPDSYLYSLNKTCLADKLVLFNVAITLYTLELERHGRIFLSQPKAQKIMVMVYFEVYLTFTAVFNPKI